MKIKILKFSILLAILLAVVVSCEDDDDVTTVFVEIDRTEQQLEDNEIILNYLASHYYNSSFFETGSNHKYTDIVITELAQDADGNFEEVPEGHTLLSQAVVTKNVTYEEADYEYYILNLNQGGGEAPKFTDAIRVRYEGSSINDEVGGEEEIFDSSIIPAEFNLQTDFFNVGAVIKAWQLVMPQFNASSSFEINNDGVVDFINPGLGVMFVPSGLAYFSGIATGSSFDNLIFKFELLQYQTVDHDNDGIPSYIEDLDEDLDVTNEDADEDGFFNFIDNDDDGDGVLTIDELIPGTRLVGETFSPNEFEISRSEVNGVMTIKTVTIADSPGSDGQPDGIPDYLDENISINYNADN
ncbi:MAG: FKBP-type peptidyl-prolyl cis-trans isomerase [Winogradskyella sp.]|uniref:FKBP-type peptidyl-prolyl cis-trans isomerase n=1 Tax=Winogradskyella sp. TaxID=1883156 RepID=UPI00385F9BF2